MPNSPSIGLGPFIPNGNPDQTAVAITSPQYTAGLYTPYAPGQLGMTFTQGDKSYTTVILDSGATSATPVGAPTANQLLYWKDKSARLVTNDKRLSLGGNTANASGNFVAGILRNTPSTLGTYGTVINALVKGHNVAVASDGSGGVGQIAISDTTASVARVAPIAVGTAPTYVRVGVMRDTPSGGAVNVDVDIPTL